MPKSLMHFAILGTDADIFALAAGARELGHKISWCGDVRPGDAAAIADLNAAAAVSDEWELLLDRASVDGVLVGRGVATAELRAEQLKRLAAEAMPLLVVHPIFDSVLPYYEIDMTRRETGAIVRHYSPLGQNPAAELLADWVANGHPSVGAIHQLTCERRVPGMARNDVLSAIARDAELLAAVAGDIRRVSAIGPAADDASFGALQVQMTSTRISSLRWSVGARLAAGAVMELALIGEHGAILLREIAGAKGAASSWELETAVGDGRTNEVIECADPAFHAIEQFSAAIASTDIATRNAASTWDIATRTMEVVDAIELSLQKGRTIEVFQQQLTEKLAFRGTMAALGCGLLLIAFLVVVAIAVLGGAEGIVGEKILPAWPLLLLAALAFFLLLQAVPLLVTKRASDKQPPGDASVPR